MKSLSISRYLGVGLGIGFASFAIYQGATQHVPEHFTPSLTEFRALPSSEAKTNYPLSVPAGGTILVQYDADGSDDNQIVLPANDELTADELQLAPEMSLDAFASATAQTVAPDTGFEPLPSEWGLEEPSVQPMQQPLHLPTPAENAIASDDSVDGLRLHQIDGSTWRPNPFSSEGGNTSPDPIAELTELIAIKSASPSSQFEELVNAAEFPAEVETLQNVVPESHQNPAVARTDDQGGGMQDWVKVDPALTASQSAIIPANMGMNESVAQRAVHHIEYGKALRDAAPHSQLVRNFTLPCESWLRPMTRFPVRITFRLHFVRGFWRSRKQKTLWSTTPNPVSV